MIVVCVWLDRVDYVVYFFFFKQKTAYEMRISDWSSDVCSSDLAPFRSRTAKPPQSGERGSRFFRRKNWGDRSSLTGTVTRLHARSSTTDESSYRPGTSLLDSDWRCAGCERSDRSEEHTSELQSLMRISYAVFCLKKTKTHNT